MATCPDGHVTSALDYCAICGSSMAEATTCRACHAPIAGRFCEECGHDSAVSAPQSTVQQNVGWTAVIAADLEFYQRVLARGGPDSVEFPQVFPERRITLRDNVLIGRRNRDQGVEPDIDLAIHPIDRGVSTQHAVLQLRDSGLTITDLGSTNGTSLNGSDELLVYGEETPLQDGDRIHVGAWTTITVVRSERGTDDGRDR
jgi:FHA domain